MPFIFLLVFALICLESPWEGKHLRPSWLMPAGSALLVGTMVVASWLFADLITRAITWQMTRHPEQRYALLQRYARWRRIHFIGLLTAFLAALYLVGWGGVLEQAWAQGLGDWFGVDGNGIPPGSQIGVIAPFLVALLLSWERFYRVEKIAYELGHFPDRFVSKETYVLLQVRHQLLLVMPPILLLLLTQVLFVFVPIDAQASLWAVAVGVALVAAVFLLMPLFLRVFLGLEPLAPGPLRERLEETARRLGFRYSNVLVWNTRHLFANAMVTGFVPWLRYIVLTDRLIADLTPDEVEAVFGHEIGHVKHHHLIFYLTFFLASVILLGFCWESIKELLRPFLGKGILDVLRSLSSFAKLGLLAVYTLLVFGFLSRRCERQADLFGSRTVSTEVFINALEKVAAINGIPRDRAGNWLLSWQHPTIAQRVEFLERMRDRPALIRRFHLSIRTMQLASVCLLVFLLWYFQSSFWKLLAEF